MVFSIILKYTIATLLISLIFGVTVSSSIVIKKAFKKDVISPYLFQLWSLIIFIIIWIYYKPDVQIFNTYNLLFWKNILLFLIAVVPASLIAAQGIKMKRTKPILMQFIDGASMEIPMRLLVQNLFFILGINVLLFNSLSLGILLNAIIWVQFILVQEAIGGRKITKAILPEVAASFWFSIWVGILYKDTGNILMPMLAHGLQRIVTHNIHQSYRSTYEEME